MNTILAYLHILSREREVSPASDGLMACIRQEGSRGRSGEHPVSVHVLPLHVDFGVGVW